jgi:hypothetical protein
MIDTKYTDLVSFNRIQMEVINSPLREKGGGLLKDEPMVHWTFYRKLKGGDSFKKRQYRPI